MALWPTTLPAPTAEGYQLENHDQTVRSDMEVGTARQRRISAASNDKLAVSWLFTDAQFAIFRAWFNDASTGIAGGASWFNGLDLALGGGITTPDCRFVGGKYMAVPKSGVQNWIVSANLEIR